jgi:chromatin remodeling complex protein RSC6
LISTEIRISEVEISYGDSTLLKGKVLRQDIEADVAFILPDQEAAKAAKKEQRDSKKKKRKDPKDMTPEELKTYEARRANNAFLVQRPLTDELCAFMGLKAGDKRSQTEVTKFISEYVKSHNCFDPTFKRRILPNAALAKLLRVDDKTEVTYLNLQKFLKVHFKKTA